MKSRNRNRFLPAIFAAISCFSNTTNAQERDNNRGYSTGTLLAVGLGSFAVGGGIGASVVDRIFRPDYKEALDTIDKLKTKIRALENDKSSLEYQLGQKTNELQKEQSNHNTTKEKCKQLQTENSDLKVKYGQVPVTDLNKKAIKLERIQELLNLYKKGHLKEDGLFLLQYYEDPECISSAMFKWNLDTDNRERGLISIANRLFLLNSIVDELSNDEISDGSIKIKLQSDLDLIHRWATSPKGAGSLDGLEKILKEKFKKIKIVD